MGVSDVPHHDIYGIKNCDTMKKARAWLDKHEREYSFHDYKTAGIERAKLEGWAKKAGWETLLNRAGTLSRKLSRRTRSAREEASPDVGAIDDLHRCSRSMIGSCPVRRTSAASVKDRSGLLQFPPRRQHAARATRISHARRRTSNGNGDENATISAPVSDIRRFLEPARWCWSRPPGKASATS